MLEDMGFEHLYGLKGGIHAWRSMGLPVERCEDQPRLWTAESRTG